MMILITILKIIICNYDHDGYDDDTMMTTLLLLMAF